MVRNFAIQLSLLKYQQNYSERIAFNKQRDEKETWPQMFNLFEINFLIFTAQLSGKKRKDYK